ncbi:flagellar motor switch protein FliM [Deferrisoma camini]|uniref:flagellar motor switch protein FliM n=1 Tax=Deferrisoma camini TaxID=1035120 RepID=UPI00046D2CF2|nr:flagellar motor switch protein FliM [Deferrisoma camini]
MSELLSQEEVNALLQSIPLQQEAAPAKPEAKPTPTRYRKRASRYDFKRPNRISKNVLQSLHFLHERYARNLALDLSAYLRTISDIVLLSVDQLSYAEFLMSLPETTCINVVKIVPQGGTLAFEVNPTLVFAVIEKLMGGSSETPTLNREITPIEQALIEGFIDMALKDLHDAWRTIGETRFELDRRETSPQLVQIVAPNEIVVVIVFEVKVGQTSGMMNLCIPAIYLEPFAVELRQEHQTDITTRMTEADYRRIDEVIARAVAGLSADLCRQRMTIRQILALKEGDLFPLGADLHQSVTVSVEGIPKFRAVFGARKGRKAVRIEAPIVDEEPEPSSEGGEGFQALETGSG